MSHEISRTNPACILILIDQSTSMAIRLKNGRSKADFLADVVNKTIYTLITSSSKADGVRDYFYLGVIAYSSSGARNGFSGPLALGQTFDRYLRSPSTHPGSKSAIRRSL